MIQLPLFEDPKPTPAEREVQQLVAIGEWLHVWNQAERERRIHATETSSGQISAQSARKSLRVTAP